MINSCILKSRLWMKLGILAWLVWNISINPDHVQNSAGAIPDMNCPYFRNYVSSGYYWEKACQISFSKFQNFISEDHVATKLSTFTGSKVVALVSPGSPACKTSCAKGPVNSLWELSKKRIKHCCSACITMTSHEKNGNSNNQKLNALFSSVCELMK